MAVDSTVTMLRTLRKARFVEVALAIGALLTLTGSLGLHPEPTGAEVFGGASSSESLKTLQATGVHTCPVCLVHRSLSLSGLPGIVLQPESTVSPLASPDLARPLRRPLSADRDRAPPTA